MLYRDRKQYREGQRTCTISLCLFFYGTEGGLFRPFCTVPHHTSYHTFPSHPPISSQKHLDITENNAARNIV